MKILFIGNANSFLLINLASALKTYYPGILVDILSHEKSTKSEALISFNKIYEISKTSPLQKMRYVKFFWITYQFSKLLKRTDNEYDAIHIFYLSAIYGVLWRKIKSKGRKKILTIFGSEFYRSNAVIKYLQERMIREADIISASNQQTLDDFCSFFNVPLQKRYNVHFGLSVLTELTHVTEQDILNFKLSNEIQNKLLVACGYNGSENQNHINIITELSKIKHLLQDIVLVFHFHEYKKEYKQQLEELLTFNGLHFLFLTGSLTNKDLAVFRKSIKVLIQLQTTDQLSGSMIEHIAAKSMVITGSWLPYNVLDDLGIKLFKIRSFSDLPDALLKTLSDGLTSAQLTSNSQAAHEFCDWENTIKNWHNLYT